MEKRSYVGWVPKDFFAELDLHRGHEELLLAKMPIIFSVKEPYTLWVNKVLITIEEI